MPDLSHIGKVLIIAGIGAIAVGILLCVVGKLPWLGRLPGDIFIKGEKSSFYFPITTCIIISIVLTLIFSLFRK